MFIHNTVSENHIKYCSFLLFFLAADDHFLMTCARNRIKPVIAWGRKLEGDTAVLPLQPQETMCPCHATPQVRNQGITPDPQAATPPNIQMIFLLIPVDGKPS